MKYVSFMHAIIISIIATTILAKNIDKQQDDPIFYLKNNSSRVLYVTLKKKNGEVLKTMTGLPIKDIKVFPRTKDLKMGKLNFENKFNIEDIAQVVIEYASRENPMSGASGDLKEYTVNLTSNKYDKIYVKFNVETNKYDTDIVSLLPQKGIFGKTEDGYLLKGNIKKTDMTPLPN